MTESLGHHYYTQMRNGRVRQLGFAVENDTTSGTMSPKQDGPGGFGQTSIYM